MKRFKSNDIVRHFKRETVSDLSTEYLYLVVGEAIDTVTDKSVVVYRALYGDKLLYTRPVEEFESEVDKEKYPNIKQKYRFERIGGSNEIS